MFSMSDVPTKPLSVVSDLTPSAPFDKRLYFNGYQVTISPQDVMINLLQNGEVQMTLNASHVTAKSFALALLDVIQKTETAIGHDYLTIDKIVALMQGKIEGM